MKSNKGSLVAERTLKALMLFSKNKYILVADVAKALDISLTAAYRIMDTLYSMGFVKRNDNKTYSLNPSKIIQLYQMVEQDIRSASRPVLKKLVEEIKESVYITVLYDDKSYIYIEKEDNPSPFFRWSTNLGEILPLPAGTAGKTHLAYLIKDLDESEKGRIISGLELKPFTKNSITNPDELKKSLNKILKDGYCFTNSEYSHGVVGFAVPIFNFDQSELVAVLGMHMLEAKYSEEKLQEYVTPLKKAAKEISENIY
ncbi:IclR family transcriptional regulator [Alkalihalobacillus oceani]|uniref:IclR family transcriptional regulator n=1 Tax=Halalkalibacter oceani TaxID=1653776 RepID=UPI00203FF7B5|nr:IclR family transcriptional regulator [Halalkalibacter oceani]MCM3759893.1 IclR family transcriptional regulator [Halalkalibacter oceani]